LESIFTLYRFSPYELRIESEYDGVSWCLCVVCVVCVSADCSTQVTSNSHLFL
jgi:hypothetical protein